MQTQFASIDEAIQYLGMPRSSFFRLKKQGQIRVEKRIDRGNKKIYYVYGLAESPRVITEPDGPPVGGSEMAVEPIPSPFRAGVEFTRPLSETHAQYIDEWIAWREQGLYTRPWSESYKRNQVQYIKRYFDRWTVISSKHLETWLMETPVMQKTLRVHKHAPVSSFAKFLVHKEVLDRDEYRRIKDLYPKKSPYYHPVQKIIYKEDIDLILQTVEKDKGHHAYQRILNRVLVQFLAATALRVSEMCDLTLSDLRFSDDPKQAFIKVKCGKGGKGRFVPFSMSAQQAVREYLSHRPERDGDSQLFVAYNPKYGFTKLIRDCVIRRFHRLSQRCGIPFSAHSFRHYRITQWANNPRIPITTVQLWAGHSSLIVTQRYIHIRNEDAMMVAFEAE